MPTASAESRTRTRQSTEPKTYYELLGVERDASPEELKTAYRGKALQFHPDRHPANRKKWAHERFIEIAEAYGVLSDPLKREEYDAYLDGSSWQEESQASTEPEYTDEEFEEILKRAMYAKPG